MRISISNRGPEGAEIWVLPTLTFRNTWSWDLAEDMQAKRPSLRLAGDQAFEVRAEHESLGTFVWSQVRDAGESHGGDGLGPEPEVVLFTKNDTNVAWMAGAESGFSKDAFDRYVVGGEGAATNQEQRGMKAAFVYRNA